jgi:hypothetical protein
MTAVSLTSQRLGDIPWLVLRGERAAAFYALGRHTRHQVRAVIEGMTELAELQTMTASPAGAATLAAVSAASHRQHPREWAELAALAAGAAVPFDDLLLLNLRGDLGDGTGCTDLAYVGANRAIIAHNEDGATILDDFSTLLTLAIDGDPPVAVWWYPGFIPANTFVLTGHGLALGIDHITVLRPAHAPGRAFVARALQHETSAARVFERVTTLPHALHLPAGIGSAYPNSEDRGRFLDRLTVPDNPGPDWFLDILAGSPLPHGVRRDGADDHSVTLCTVVVDLLDRRATIQRRNGQPVSIPTSDLIVSYSD